MAGRQAWMEGYRAASGEEAVDLARLRSLLAEVADPYDRTLPMHVTGSAVVIHPPTRRVLLRWHQRQQAWLQVGGHADAGETDPLEVATREAAEETGLSDLVNWPPAHERPLHIVIVPVAPKGLEPAHEHADVRYVLATDSPEEICPEQPSAPLRWLLVPEAAKAAPENLKVTIERLAALMSSG